MKSKLFTCSSVAAVFIALATPVRLAAQDNQEHRREHHKYKLIDLGTLGGPNSAIPVGFPPTTQVLNRRGTVVGISDLPSSDPYTPNCLGQGFGLDCFVAHAFQWQNGALTDLGALADGISSFPFSINERGSIVGGSENGKTDPLTSLPETDAVLWRDGQIVKLGTLGGTQGTAFAVNDREQVVGAALNEIEDPFSTAFFNIVFFTTTPFTGTTQQRAFLWQEGEMQDLGTLGGPDSGAGLINARGQVAGASYTNSTPNPVTNTPTIHPFLWDDGTMLDLGTLGGTIGFPAALNSRGQVAGQSNMAGDQTHHPFLWDRGALTDLGTLGGNNGETWWLNDLGQVVGRADLTGSLVHHAFLWRHGKMTDLGTLPGKPCSTGKSVNLRNQVVGNSAICFGVGPAFLWENGGPMVNLQTLLLPGSDVTVGNAEYINDRGEIAGTGTLPNGDMLIPCDSDHPGVDGCDYDPVDLSSIAESTPLINARPPAPHPGSLAHKIHN